MKHYISGSYFLIILLILITIPGTGNCRETTKVGTTAASFLKIEVGARASAMGGAFVSVANDLTSMYWNPAGLAYLNAPAAQFENFQYFAGMSHNFGAAAFNLGNSTMIGVSLVMLNSGDIGITTEEKWEGTGETYDVTNMAIGLTISQAITDRLNGGITCKYIDERIWRNSARGLAVDLGLIIDTGIYGFNLGMCLSNIGTSMSMDGIDMQFDKEAEIEDLRQPESQLLAEEWPLPSTFRVGISGYLLGQQSEFFKAEKSEVLTCVDLINSIDSKLKTNFGFEYIYNKIFSLRTGYRVDYDITTFSVGGGVKIKLKEMGNVAFNYSFTDFGVFNGLHRFSIFFTQ